MTDEGWRKNLSASIRRQPAKPPVFSQVLWKTEKFSGNGYPLTGTPAIPPLSGDPVDSTDPDKHNTRNTFEPFEKRKKT